MRAVFAALLFAAAPLAPALALPPLLEAAIVAAEAVAPSDDARFGFRQTIVSGDEFGAVFVFDPGAETPWSLVEPDEAAREAAHGTVLKRRNETEAEASGDTRGDRDILVATPRKTVGQSPSLLREDEATATFAVAVPDDADMPAAARDVIRAEVTVAKDRPRLISYRIYAEKSFKPSVAARVDAFEMEMRFAQLGETGPYFVAETVQRVRGNAMFRDFDQATTVTVSDLRPTAAD